ncbi:unnamed protein product [Discosporangium mesarthrocarpum]
MGLRVFWVHDWVLRSANLAVKRFDPSTALIRTKRTFAVDDRCDGGAWPAVAGYRHIYVRQWERCQASSLRPGVAFGLVLVCFTHGQTRSDRGNGVESGSKQIQEQARKAGVEEGERCDRTP